MSWLRQRAIELSGESILRAFRPELARARLVRGISSDSADESNELPSHARLRAGTARVTTEVSAKSRATASAMRRVVFGIAELAPSDIRSGTSNGDRAGFRCCRNRRFGGPGSPSRDGPGGAGFGGTGRS